MLNQALANTTGVMMTPSSDALALLDALPETALILTLAGRVEHASRPALSRFGRNIIGTDLAALCQDPVSFRSFLRRASGSRQALPGSLRTRPEIGLDQFRAYASLLTPTLADSPARLFIRLSPIEDQRFQALTTKVRELNAEIRQRQHAQAVLEETLQERNLLLRELHHRVKNNMQMLSGMLASAQREMKNEEARAVLMDASRRLVAVGAVQQMLYSSNSFTGVQAQEFLETITSAVLQASGQRAHLVIDAGSFQLANDLAVPISLILNELLANALKYGRPLQGDPEIRVRLEFARGDYLLSIEDNGPGFDIVETRKRASGLGLVRGLARQLGASLTVERNPGARVLVRFKDRCQLRVEEVAS
jgi:two-component sensor histidine kinase